MGKEDLITKRMVHKELVIDLTPMAGPTIFLDLEHRDFTFNAMAFGLHDNTFHDPFGGWSALERRQVNCVNPKNLLRDPLRILRAARLALELECTLPTTTMTAMMAASEHLTKVAKERIGLELQRIMAHPLTHGGLQILLDCKALSAIFPFLASLENLEQNEFHHLNVLQHTMLVIEKIDALLADNPFDEIELQLEEKAILKWAGLFHDTGKALAKTVDSETGQIHFYGHERFSAHLARERLNPLGLGKQLISRIVNLIEYHLIPLQLTFSEPKNKTIRKLVYNAGENLPLLLFLVLADTKATGGKEFASRLKNIKSLCRKLLTVYCQERNSLIKPLVNGKDLLALGLSPGPRMGKIIRAIHQRQINGECSDRQAALALAKKLVATSSSTTS